MDLETLSLSVCSKKNAKFLLADVRKATFLGECQPEPNGFLLAEHEDPIGSTMFACLPSEPLISYQQTDSYRQATGTWRRGQSER